MSDIKFLDKAGLTYFMGKIKSELDKKASLGDSGKVPASQLPSYVDDVVEFNGIVEGITINPTSTPSTTGSVVFDKTTKNFAFGVQEGLSSQVTYYINWADREAYENVEDGVYAPYTGKIYVDVTTNKTYRWSGSALVEIGGGSGISLGETSDTAYAGDKGAQNAKDIAAIKSGDLPLVTPQIVAPASSSYVWIVKNQNNATVLTTSSLYLSTIYGYLATFKGCLKWESADGYKDPTAIGDGAWSGKTLPASGVLSDQVSLENITEDKVITASVKAPKQGLVLSNGIIKEASSTDFDTASTTASVHFQYKVVAAALSSQITSSSLVSLLASSANGGNYTLQNGKSKVATGVTTSEQEYYVYAYPATLGYLTKITMNDATPLLSDGFILSQFTVIDPETNASIKYNVYTSVQKGAFTNAKLDIA